MKKQYIEQVKKRLFLPRKKKEEILRDLEEAFLSAQEHGETELQVIERLGSPEVFAQNIQEQLGIDFKKRRERKGKIGLVTFFTAAALFLAAGIFIRSLRPAEHIIGQADSMTSILVTGSSFDPALLFLILGCILLILTVLWAIRLHSRRF